MNSKMITEDNNTLAIKYMLFASFLFGFTASFAKLLSEHLSSVEVSFFRCLIGSIMLLYVLKNFNLTINKQAVLLISRGLMGAVGLLAYFYSIANMPLSEATTFSKTSPIFTVIFAYLFLKEKLNLMSIIAIIIGFIGIAFIMEVDFANIDKTHYIGIVSGVLAGAAYTSIRELRKYYSPKAIVASFMFCGAIIPSICLLIGSITSSSNDSLDFMIAPFVVPNFKDILFIAGLGVSAYYSQMYMTKSYMLSHSKLSSTISYNGIVFAGVFGIVLGDMLPSYYVAFGVCLVIASGIIIQIATKNTTKKD